MRVAVVQHDIVWEDAEANFSRLAPTIAGAAAAGARLVVLTEMFATGFSMATDRIAQPVDGPSAAFLRTQARAHDVWVCGSAATRDPARARPTNTFLLAAPDGPVHRYDKMHPFSYGGEHEHYEGGDGPVTFVVDGLRVTPFVCYDLRFGEPFWAMAGGTDLYVVVANWPAPRRLHWRVLLQARAVENQAYVVGANRVGAGGGLEYAGDSCIVDPLGEVLASAAGVETVLVADVDPAAVASCRTRFPFLRDRRGPGGTAQHPGGAISRE